MGLHFDGEYFAKSRDAGPYVPPSIPTDRYKENYDLIRWDNDNNEEERVNEGRSRNASSS